MEDIFGLKPYGETLKITVEQSVVGAGNFLAKICMPAAEEFGLLIKDRIRYWRLNNVIKMIEFSKNKLDFNNDNSNLRVNPRIGIEIIDNASWQDDDTILKMWSGLLVSSTDENGNDDSNLIFINLLKTLTRIQCRILNYMCENSEVKFDKNGLIHSDSKIEISIQKLFEITSIRDISRLDREIDHMNSLNLFLAKKKRTLLF